MDQPARTVEAAATLHATTSPSKEPEITDGCSYARAGEANPTSFPEISFIFAAAAPQRVPDERVVFDSPVKPYGFTLVEREDGELALRSQGTIPNNLSGEPLHVLVAEMGLVVRHYLDETGNDSLIVGNLVREAVLVAPTPDEALLRGDVENAFYGGDAESLDGESEDEIVETPGCFGVKCFYCYLGVH